MLSLRGARQGGDPRRLCLPPSAPDPQDAGVGGGGVPGRAPEKAPPLPSTSCGRGRENVSAVAEPAAGPLRAETGESVLPRPFGSRARHLEGPGSGREIPSFPRKAPNLRPPAPADPRGRPPSPPVPPPPWQPLARSLGTGSMQRSALC